MIEQKSSEHEARISRNEKDIQDVWAKITIVEQAIMDIKEKLLGRPSWPIMVTLIVAFKIIAILMTVFVMRAMQL